MPLRRAPAVVTVVATIARTCVDSSLAPMSTQPPSPPTAAPGVIERVRAAVAAEPLLPALCLALVVAGPGLRCQHLMFPARLTFDEHHFVENARNSLAGRPDWNDHPPLGKL